MLEDHPDATAQTSQPLAGQKIDFLAIDNNLPAGWTLQLVDQPDKRAFTGTAFADDPENFAVSHLKTKIVQRNDFIAETAFGIDL